MYVVRARKRTESSFAGASSKRRNAILISSNRHTAAEETIEISAGPFASNGEQLKF